MHAVVSSMSLCKEPCPWAVYYNEKINTLIVASFISPLLSLF